MWDVLNGRTIWRVWRWFWSYVVAHVDTCATNAGMLLLTLVPHGVHQVVAVRELFAKHETGSRLGCSRSLTTKHWSCVRRVEWENNLKCMVEILELRCCTCWYLLKIYTTLGYIVSLILLNLGHVYIFNYKMFHQEASVETIKLLIFVQQVRGCCWSR